MPQKDIFDLVAGPSGGRDIFDIVDSSPSPEMLADAQSAQARLRTQMIPAGLQGANPQKIGNTPLGSQLIGVDPSTLVDRMAGGAASIVNTLLPGGDANKKYPIPQLTPNQQIGEKAVALGGAAQGVQAAAEAVAPAVAGRLDLARIWNQVADVPAGRKGAEVATATGLPKTNPGNAPIRALQEEGTGALGQITSAVTARPNVELYGKVYGELNRSGRMIDNVLAQSPQTIQFDVPATKKALEAAKAAGLQMTGDTNQVTAPLLNAHKFRSELGSRIQWNPNAMPTEANEQMKDLFFQIGNDIQSSAGQGVAVLNKRWQEAYLYTKALKTQLDLQLAGGKVPMSMAQKGAIVAAEAAAGAAGVGELYRRFR